MADGTRIVFAVGGAKDDLASVTVDDPYDTVRGKMSGAGWPEFNRNGRRIAVNPALIAYVEPALPSVPLPPAQAFRVARPRGADE
jgi:hypothetical protein